MRRTIDRPGDQVPAVALTDEAPPRPRRVAWAVVLVLVCAFSYSIGWQKGWINGSAGAERQFKRLNDVLLSTHAPAAANDASDDAGESA